MKFDTTKSYDVTEEKLFHEVGIRTKSDEDTEILR